MERTGSTVGGLLSLSDGTVQQDYLIAGSFKSRATDVEAVIPSACAVSDFGASSYGFVAYTAADPDAIMVQPATFVWRNLQLEPHGRGI